MLHIRVKGERGKASSIIELTRGVKEIVKTDTEDDGSFSFTIKLEEGASDDVKNDIMSELISAGLQISEIYSDRPDLESVFVDLMNRPTSNSGLKDLLAEMEDEPSGEASDDKKEDEE